MIEKIEKSMLFQLDFRTNTPTTIEFINYFLYLSNPMFDFSSLVFDTRVYAYISLIGKLKLKFIDQYLCRLSIMQISSFHNCYIKYLDDV
jgi:hypothetical protein